MGSKNRLAKHILPIILKDRKEGQWYVEPFVGGCNLIDKVTGNRIGNDINPYVISLFKGIQEGFIPPNSVSELEYSKARFYKDVSPLTSFIGFGCSYGGKWFGGYARSNDSYGFPRNHCLESKNNILKQSKNIKDIKLLNLSYERLEIPPNSIIYCDPPYKSTTRYKDTLDYSHFYKWLFDKHREGHTIFISEFSMPSGFTCVWGKEQVTTMSQNKKAKPIIERLFTIL